MALPTVTNCIKDCNYDQLTGLFSQRAKEALIKNIETNWTELQKNNINVDIKDITSAVIEKISFHTLGREVYVDIKVKFCAIKQDLQPPMSIELLATFSRKYGPACFPDWTVTHFQLNHVGMK